MKTNPNHHRLPSVVACRVVVFYGQMMPEKRLLHPELQTRLYPVQYEQ